MEQTLGKRIAQNRKNLGLTQDQLAEKLGVTAQAVSKWENDQSCPDINILPQLAEIFNISVDELLGREPKATVQTQVVEDEDDAKASEGIHIQNGNWEFKWDSGRRSALAFAGLVLLVGILSLLSKIYEWDVSFWGILWPSTLLVYGLKNVLHKFSFFSLGCVLFGGYFLIDNLGVWELNLTSELIFPIIVVLFGISLLVDALRKPKKPRFRIVHKGGNSKKTKNDYSTSHESFDCSISFGEDNRTVSLPRLSHGDVSVSFGELILDLSGCQEVSPGCHIDATCSFGELILRVPSRFCVEFDSSTAFGSVNVSGSPDPNPAGTIYLDASANFGEIVVKYI